MSASIKTFALLAAIANVRNARREFLLQPYVLFVIHVFEKASPDQNVYCACSMCERTSLVLDVVSSWRLLISLMYFLLLSLWL